MNIHLKPFFQATPSTLHDLEALQGACLAADGDAIPIYKNVLTERRLEPFWMAYAQDGHCVGFISAYYFFEHGAEVALMVHPIARGMSLAKKLLAALYPRLIANKVSFVSFSAIEVNKDWLFRRGGVFHHLECRLDYLKKELLPLHGMGQLRRASIDDKAAIQTLEMACFGEEMDGSHLERLLLSSQYEVWLLLVHHRVVGKVHLRHDGAEMLLSNLAVHPDAQRQSHGTHLLKQAINVSVGANKRLYLDVEAQNQGALSLYLKHGFEMTSKIWHWHFNLEKIEAFCLL